MSVKGMWFCVSHINNGWYESYWQHCRYDSHRRHLSIWIQSMLRCRFFRYESTQILAEQFLWIRLGSKFGEFELKEDWLLRNGRYESYRQHCQYEYSPCYNVVFLYESTQILAEQVLWIRLGSKFGEFDLKRLGEDWLLRGKFDFLRRWKSFFWCLLLLQPLLCSFGFIRLMQFLKSMQLIMA